VTAAVTVRAPVVRAHPAPLTHQAHPALTMNLVHQVVRTHPIPQVTHLAPILTMNLVHQVTHQAHQAHPILLAPILTMNQARQARQTLLAPIPQVAQAHLVAHQVHPVLLVPRVHQVARPASAQRTLTCTRYNKTHLNPSLDLMT
jgi:hypothetical protein